MKSKALLVSCTVALYALHQDFWFWRDARPLFFGFLPVGLAYHAVYCVLCSLLLIALTRWAWPQHLEDEVARDDGPARPTRS